MKKFVSLFAILLAIVLATASMNAQENRKVAFYAIGAGSIDSGSSSSNISGRGLGTQVGAGVDINPEGFGLGLRFTNGSPVDQSFSRGFDNLPPWYTGQVPQANYRTENRSRVFSAMFQKGLGNQKAKLILGAGPGVLLTRSNITESYTGVPANFPFGDTSTRSFSNKQNIFVGTFGATIVVRGGKNFDFRFGVQYLRGFTGEKQSFIMPVGGAGVGF